MSLSEMDNICFRKAIELACEAERQKNLPIGAVIRYQEKIVGQGKNAIWFPESELKPSCGNGSPAQCTG